MADFDLTQSGQEIQSILDGAAMQTDLTAETERAEQAEQQLQSNIDLEETRAKAAEKQNADDIDVIESKIPAAASSENKLADKAFVSSSIATATATYRGAYNLVSDLHLTIDATEQQIAAALAGAISTADNNDYCFVQIPTADATPTQIAAIERYKFNGTAWAYEYTLNNSGFTADQWAALNSGITTGLVAKLAALPTNDELTLLLAGKQPMLTFDNVPTEGSNNPVKSGGVKSAIDSEKERAQGAEQANAGNIAQVVAMIPAAASSENQLADKNFVNSSIATNTATYRGAYNEVSDLSLTVDATHEQIAAALAGAISTADNNDYCFVQIPTADATPTQIAAIERYKFNGEAWAYEYTLNNSGFTADQWAAINSGITSGLVAKLAALPTNDDLVAALAGKQPMLTFDNVPTESSTNPVKSGGVYAAIAEEAGTRAAAIAAIVALIPSAASALNQLADKAFVNSSISTATAVFKGTFNVVADLELNYNASQAQIALMLGSKIASADNNDYCFVQIPTSNETPLEIARTDRYKYNGTAWAYEYTLNNSGFTAAQWAAINSGITSLLKDKLIDLPTATELATQLAAKQNALTFDTTPTEGSTNPVTSDGIKAAIDTEKARALAAEQGLQDDYDELYALYQTLEGGSIIPVAAADWPVSNPQQNVIYRVANSATPTAYSDYMYNGTATLLLATFTFPGIDSEPTPDSTNLVTSGGTFDAIMQNGPAFDLSAYNAVGGTLATYADLSAALTALNALPAAYKKGGMSMKFVLSSDNKYVQARCMADEFTTDTTQWAIADEGVYVENPEFAKVVLDNENKILEAVRIDGTKLLPAGVEINEKIDFEGNETTIIESPEFVEVKLDSAGHIFWGIQKDGNVFFGAGVPQQIIDYVEEKLADLSLDEYEDIVAFLNGLEEGDKTLQTLLNEKVDKEEGKSLIDAEYASSQSAIENPEFLDVTLDAEDKVLEGIKEDGTKVIGGSINVGGNARILGNMEVSGVSYKVIENQEYLAAWVDAENKVIFGLKANGKTYVGDADFLNDIENIKAFLANITDKNIDWDALSSITTAEHPEFIEAKTDSEGKLLAGRTTDGAAFENIGFSTPKVSIDGHTIENIEDPEERLQIGKDSENRIYNYRKKDGTLVENVGIETPTMSVTGKLNLGKAPMDSLTSDILLSLNMPYMVKKFNLPDYGSIDIICELYYLGTNNKKYNPTKVTKVNDVFYVTSTLTKIVDPETGDITYEVNENSIATTYTEIDVDFDDATLWPVDKTKHYCKVKMKFGDVDGTYYAQVSFQGASTLIVPKKGLRITPYKDAAFSKKQKLKIGEMIETSKFNCKAYYGDPTRLRDVVLQRLVVEARYLRDYNEQFPWNADYPMNTAAVGTIQSFPVKLTTSGNFYGVSMFGLAKDDRNFMLDGDETGMFLSGDAGPVTLSFAARFIEDMQYKTWTDEMNDVDEGEHTPSNLAACEKFWDFINERLYTDSTEYYPTSAVTAVGDKHYVTETLVDGQVVPTSIEVELVPFDKVNVPRHMSVIDWIDYYIFVQVFRMRDNDIHNLILYTGADKTKFYAFLYDLDLSWGRGYTTDMPIDEPRLILWKKFVTLYWDEIVERYKNLRSTILNYNHALNIISSIQASILYSDFEAEMEKWNAINYNNATKNMVNNFKDCLIHFDKFFIN